jgi:hypothetical protein
MIDTTYIYGLFCPVENKICYVGKSHDPVNRLRTHITLAPGPHAHHDTPKVRWLQGVASAGRSRSLLSSKNSHANLDT